LSFRFARCTIATQIFKKRYQKLNQMIKQSKFLKVGVFVAITLALVMTGCSKDEDTPPAVAPANIAPTATVSVNPTSVAPGATAQITVTAADANGDVLTYAYSANGGAVNGSGASVSWTAPSTAGSYQVTVTVTDGRGGSVSANGSLTVTAVGPMPTQITGTATLPPGSSVDLSNAVVRIFLDEASWNNFLPVQQVAVTGSGASVSFTIPNVAPQTYRLEIWKDLDGDGNFSQGDIQGHFGQSPGVIDWNVLSPIIVTANQTNNVGAISMVIL
jgi:hypothetical protein